MFKLVLLLSLLAAPVYAKETYTCAQLGEAAEIVMTMRQNGISERKIIALGTQHTELSAEFFRNLAIAAYQYPAYSHSLLRDSAKRDLGHKVYTACKARN